MIRRKTLRFFLLLACIFSLNSYAQVKKDSARVDSSGISLVDSANAPAKNTYLNIISSNKYLNTSLQPVSLINQEKGFKGKEFLFYLVGSVVLLFGMMKVFYDRYFKNIFRVFFNTSLRQNQLTDLLLQARLPSLIFNIFFAITGGLYAWLLLVHYNVLREKNIYIVIPLCIFVLGVVYVGKILHIEVVRLDNRYGGACKHLYICHLSHQ